MIIPKNDIDLGMLKNNEWKENGNSFIYPNCEEKSVFFIKIWQKGSKVIVNYSFNPSLAESVENMIFFLEQYKLFLNRTIKIAGKKLFGDIITGKKDFKPEDTSEVDNSILYWKNARKIENEFGIKFNLSNIGEHDLEYLSVLIVSFINHKPCKIGNLENMEMKVKDKSEIEKIKGAKGNFIAVLDSHRDNICGVNLNGFYKVLFYGPIEIINYKVVEERKNSIKCRLINKVNKDTVASIMYFKSEEDAQEAAHKRIEEFKHAEYAWKVNIPDQVS